MVPLQRPEALTRDLPPLAYPGHKGQVYTANASLIGRFQLYQLHDTLCE